MIDDNMIRIVCSCGEAFHIPRQDVDGPLGLWRVGDHGGCLIPDNLREQVMRELGWRVEISPDEPESPMESHWTDGRGSE